MSPGQRALAAFEGQGIELEYMIVDRDSLMPLPIADRVLATEAGRQTSELLRGDLGWSNEFVMHVIEIKNPDPRLPLSTLGPALQREVRYLNRMLEHFHARLMPTAMHPLMKADSARFWPQDPQRIYETYGGIFNCATHGWVNLQSMHLNLPFAGDEQFARLHAAIRLLLPLLPALAASSPLLEGQATGALDTRMQVYAHNADEVPQIAGALIPESVHSRAQYEREILEPMYRAMAAHDPRGVLRHEWLNSRAAIPRFERSAIEIRVLDTQENPRADAAIAAAVIGMLRYLMQAAPLAMQEDMPTESLATIYQSCVEQADQALVENEEYLARLGLVETSCTAGEALRILSGKAVEDGQMPRESVDILLAILEHGPLARRILRALDGDLSEQSICRVYRQLCDCLDQGRLFLPDAA